MKCGKYQKNPPASPRKRPILLILCLVLTATLSVGATLAYYAVSSTPVINTFSAGSAGARIDEEIDDNVKKAITVTNTGDSPVFVRVRLVGYWENADGTIAAKDAPNLTFDLGSGWKPNDGYYYYTSPVGAGQSTSDLLGSNLAMEAGQVIEVLADTVQAAPKDAVLDVWGGIDPTTLG